MNATFKVASFYSCDRVFKPDFKADAHSNDPIWKQTELGCQILHILRDMYGFNVTYVPEYLDDNVTETDDLENASIYWNKDADIYLRPMNLRTERLDFMYPVHAAYTWKYGFMFRLSASGFYRTFYSKPFTRPAWNCLYAMALFISILFYFMKKWEFSVVGGWNCSYAYELLMVIGAYCQHIPPIEARLPSRRIAYFVFFMFAYVVYTFYTSNLLSHLVNDKKHTITLETLTATNMECVIVDYMMLTVTENIPSYNHNGVLKKLDVLRPVTVTEGIEGVMTGTMAVFSDYISLYPHAKKLSSQEVCEISTIDLFPNIKKYFYTSKHFPYIEQFKIGALRAKETGILKHWKVKQEIPSCTSTNVIHTKFVQISIPLLVLLCTYIISIFVMLLERQHYKRNKVWPFVN